MERTTTVDEIFRLPQGSGGLHNLFDGHDVRVDKQGRVTIAMTVTEHMLNPHGTAHGGTIFALCNMAVGSFVALKIVQPITLDSTIHFYRPALPGAVLTAVVNERKQERVASFFLVEVYDDKENHIADTTFTMYCAKPL